MIIQITDIGPESAWYTHKNKIIGCFFKTVVPIRASYARAGWHSTFFSDVPKHLQHLQVGGNRLTPGNAICQFKYKEIREVR